jgi:molybdate transport system regulatory protein
MDLKTLRARLGLKQADLAELLGVHAMTVSRWERGELKPSAHQRRLLRAFADAAERGARLPQRGKRPDPVRFLSDLLAQARSGPEIDLGALSATNRFAGRVVELARGDVVTKVVVEVAPGVRFGSVITTDSVDRLGLAVGARVTAIVKATDVMLASGGA